MPANKKASSIKVRMYRQGFGDCFLLQIFDKEKAFFNILIDCGIKWNAKEVPTCPIGKVIDDLKETLTPEGGGRPVIDVLVATHEHWDHIAYFHPTRKFGQDVAPNFFGDFDIKQVWLAWTENPDDDEAVKINSRLRDSAVALQLAARRIHEATEEEFSAAEGSYYYDEIIEARTRFNQQMDDILGFYGVSAAKEVSESGIKYKENGTISSTTEQAMENLISIGKKGGVIRYFNPGTTVDKSMVPDGIKVHVLGPPRSAMINKSTPSHGHAQETYLGIDQFGMTSFVDGLMQMAGDELGAAAGMNVVSNDPNRPFGGGVGISVEDAEKSEFFDKHYYSKKAGRYRQIENNWLNIAGHFALQLDGAINNTSLVLAIELEESGKVLLFPGDAQVGSWLSWHDYEWSAKEGESNKKQDASDLLAKTVLYKVSHHGSHNATVKEKGLELMTHPELVAMIPEKEDSYNGILYEPLVDRLEEMCRGRVLVSADKNHPPEKLKVKPPQMTEKEHEEFLKRLNVENPLYIEYLIE